MIKIIDIDELFDKYISDYVYSNIGKVKPEEIEDKIPLLYTEFGDKPLKELEGKTPNTYYKDFSQTERLDALKKHIESGVAVSDFLCEAIEGGDIDSVIKELNGENGEVYTNYLLNFIDVSNTDKATDRLLDFVLFNYPESERELATEILQKFPDKVKERILSSFDSATPEVKGCLAEILSKCTHDQAVFDLLVKAFIENKKSVAIYAGYLGKYGDERAIEYLQKAAEDEKIDYADFEEIRFNIELLGGEYTGTRNFSTDKIRKKLQGAKNTGIIGNK